MPHRQLIKAIQEMEVTTAATIGTVGIGATVMTLLQVVSLVLGITVTAATLFLIYPKVKIEWRARRSARKD